MVKVKLCGMTRKEDILAVNEIRPDYIGFVFWEKSRRNVSVETARKLKALLSKEIKTVGVFVDADPEFIRALYDENIIEMAQLHGGEDESVIGTLKSFGIPTIKAFKVTDEESVEKALKSGADYIIFDPGKGDGAVFNWNLIKDVKRPFFLAGGLNPANVSEAICVTKPYAVDVSSGIETDQKKDPAKMRDFVLRAGNSN